jgi:hypothetical protein
MNLNLIKNESAKKIQISVAFYEPVLARLYQICEKEELKPAAVLRSALNDFIVKYDAESGFQTELELTQK